MKTWERYIFIKFLKLFLSFLLIFFLLYVLIDSSLNVKSFTHSGHSFLSFVTYYLFHFSKRLIILFPVTLMLASIRLLTQCNKDNELLALVTGGIPLWKLMRPIVFIALLITGVSYINTQFFLPQALTYLEPDMKTSPFSLSSHPSTHFLPTKDAGPLVYQKYNHKTQQMFDIWWFKSSEELIRMKYLNPFKSPPKGKFVDHLQRLEDKSLKKKESFIEESFPTLDIDLDALEIQSRPPETLSISELFTFALKASKPLQPILWSWFWFKSLLPIISLFAVIFPVSFCTRFERNLNFFLIYAVGLFLLLTLFTLMDAALIIGENGALPSYVIVALPMVVYLLFFSWKLKQSS